MVYILSNGEIVQDDDPRAQQRSTGSSSGSGANTSNRQGFVQHQEYNQQYGGGPQAQTVSIFDVANQKLLDAGFPRWNLGSYTVEPIASVGCLLAGFMFGLQGILFAALLFFVVKWSQQGSQQTRGSTGGQYWPGGGGGPGGHRLGQS